MKTRVLIVDDSATMRALLTRLLSQAPDLEVIGTAADARQARVMIREMNPDVVTLDIEMPGMNGLDFLDKIMRLRPMPVVIVSGVTQQGCDVTVRALELGAVDCYAKPDGAISNFLDHDGGALAAMVSSAARVRRWRGMSADMTAGGAVPLRNAALRAVAGTGPVAPGIDSIGTSVTTDVRFAGASATTDALCIVIGASTGGVEALHHILPSFPENCPPTVIVQHISAAFAPAMAQRLDAKCAAKVQLVEPGLPLRPGHIYIAPGNDRHAIIGRSGQLSVNMVPGDPVSGHRPSVDRLFESAAQRLGPAAVGILLTGMGQDGAKGLLAMRQAGARTIAQDQASSTVYGMPRAAASLGAAMKILPLPHIAGTALGMAGW
ncbi:MAG: chemotaxis response regulator protein-glutamate methylesterase [Sphingobium sp.]|nr:chemotaxis response regulator protein-glutamate methylesterase [Sphingobium sp.]